MKVYLEYQDAQSQKFWEVTVADNSHTVRYGKVGAKGRSTTKTFDNAAMAQHDAEQKIRAKQDKGYAIISDSRQSEQGKENNAEHNSENQSESMTADALLSHHFTKQQLDAMSNTERAKIGLDKVLQYYRATYQELPISDEDMIFFDTLLDDLHQSDKKLASIWSDSEMSQNEVFQQRVPTDVQDRKAFVTTMWLYIKKDIARSIEDIFTAFGSRSNKKVKYLKVKRNLLGFMFNELTFDNLGFTDAEMTQLCRVMAATLTEVENVWKAIEKLDDVIPYPYDSDVCYVLAEGFNERVTSSFNFLFLFDGFEERLAKKDTLSGELDTALRIIGSSIFIYEASVYDLIKKHSPYLNDTLPPFDIPLIAYVEQQSNANIYGLIKACMYTTGAKPSKSFNNQYTKAVAALGEDKVLPIALDIAEIVLGYALKDFRDYDESDAEKFCRGLVFALMNFDDSKAVDFIVNIMAQCYKGGLNVKLGNSCAYALSQIPNSAGLNALIEQKELVISKQVIRTLDKNIAIIEVRNAPDAQHVEAPVEPLPQQPKIKITAEEFLNKLRNFPKTCAEYAGFRILDCTEDDIQGELYGTECVIYDERGKKGKSARGVLLYTYTDDDGLELTVLRLKNPKKFYIDVNATPIKKKVDTVKLFHRYRMFAHWFAANSKDNVFRQEQSNPVVCVDYYWDFAKIDRTFKNELKHFADDPHLAMYWLMYFGFTLDSRIEQVQDAIAEHKLAEQMPDLQAGIEFFADFEPSLNVPIFDKGNENYRNIFIIRTANMLWSVYSYDYRGGEQAFDKWWLTVNLHKKPDRNSAVRAFWLVKNLEKFQQWEKFEHQKSADFACSAWVQWNNPHISKNRKATYADTLLTDLWDNRMLYALSPLFYYDDKPAPLHENTLILQMLHKIRYHCTDSVLLQKTAKFYCQHRDGVQHYLNDIINTARENIGIDGRQIKQIKNDLDKLLAEHKVVWGHCDPNKPATLSAVNEYFQQYKTKALLDVANNFEDPKPWRATDVAYHLYRELLRRPLEARITANAISDAVCTLASYGDEYRNEYDYNPLAEFYQQLITSANADDEKIDVIFAIINHKPTEWTQSIGIALQSVITEPAIFERVLALIPTLKANIMFNYRLSFKEKVLNDALRHVEQLSDEQMSQLLDVCWDKLKLDVVFSLANIICNSKTIANAQAWWAKNDFDAWLATINPYDYKEPPKEPTWQETLMLTIPQREQPPKHWQDEKDWHGDMAKIHKAHKGHRLVGGVLGANGVYLIAEKQYSGNKAWTGSRRTQLYFYDETSKQWQYHYYPDLGFHACAALYSLADCDFWGVSLGGSIITKHTDSDFSIEREALPLWCPTGIKVFDDGLYVSTFGGVILKRTHDGQWQHLTQDFAQACFSKDSKGFTCFDGFSPDELYAGGEDGNMWLYHNGYWQPLEVPITAVNYDPSHNDYANIDHIVCGSDGVVYIAGSCGILKGRGTQWQVAANVQNYIESMLWHKGALYFTTGAFGDGDIYCLKSNGKLEKLCIPSALDVSTYHGKFLTANDDKLMLVTQNDAVTFDGKQWERVF